MQAQGRIKEMSEILEAIRKAIREAEISRYEISRSLDIDQGQLSKLMHGKAGLSIENLERLADFLDLEIIIRPKQRTRKGK
jgi:predicted XRE-type DNA-binding protein